MAQRLKADIRVNVHVVAYSDGDRDVSRVGRAVGAVGGAGGRGGGREGRGGER